MGRQPAMTKLGPKRTRLVRGRGANMKFRALRVDSGNFSWGSETVTKKTRILDVVYNATNNELVRTKTIVKNCIIQIDANPFRLWYLKNYDVELNKKKTEESDKARAETKRSRHILAKIKGNAKDRALDAKVGDQFNSGRLLACVSSRPG